MGFAQSSRQGRSQEQLTSPLEEQRERLMENEAPDLPFAGEQNVSAKQWGIILAAVLCGLAIPLLYILLSFLGAISVSLTGFYILTGILVLTAIAAIYLVYRLTRY